MTGPQETHAGDLPGYDSAVPRADDVSRLAWRLRWRTAPRAASRMRILVARATHRHCTVRIPDSVFAGPGFRLEIPGTGTLDVGPGVQFRRGFYCEIDLDGKVEIGADTIFTGETMIQCSTSISIGSRCAFGQATFMADGTHRFRDWTTHMLDQGYDYRPLVIEDGAIVLTKSTVVANIGRHAVIGANSLVNRDVPAYCLAGGVPARVLEYFGPPENRPPGVDA